ncbi:TIGR04255 family protein, partial [Candidatus Saganbacteria bacterium]|nr:TIGR04255 family protein [Candidatus Saganbacteria bacterium]
MPFNVPHVDRKEIIKSFKKHILNTVILRMDFADIFDAKELASKMVAKFAKDFPQRDEETEELLGQTEFAIVPVKKITSYIMRNNDTRNYIKVSQNSILLEYKTYETFEKLIEIFNEVLAIYLPVYAENKILRVGLRKINLFDKEEKNSMEKFEGYFNELLLP